MVSIRWKYKFWQVPLAGKVIVALVFVTSSGAVFGKGADTVRAEFPQVHEAFLNVLGLVRTSDFFRGWTEDEVLFLKDRWTNFFLELRAEDVQLRYHRLIIGGLGEALLMARIKNEFPSSKFLSEAEYLFQNRGLPLKSRFRPDGLVYQLKGSTLVLLRIAEAKMNKANFEISQLEGYVSDWRELGLVVEGKHYRPDEIFVLTTAGTKPLRETETNGLLPQLTVFASRVRPRLIKKIAYNHQAIPISPLEWESLVGEIVERVGKGLLSIAPSMRPIKFRAFNQYLREKIVRGEVNFPSSSGDIEEKYWAKWMPTNGGAASLFPFLDPEVQDALTKVGYVPGQNLQQNRKEKAWVGLCEYLRGRRDKKGAIRWPSTLVADEKPWAIRISVRGGRRAAFEKLPEDIRQGILLAGEAPKEETDLPGLITLLEERAATGLEVRFPSARRDPDGGKWSSWISKNGGQAAVFDQLPAHLKGLLRGNYSSPNSTSNQKVHQQTFNAFLEYLEDLLATQEYLYWPRNNVGGSEGRFARWIRRQGRTLIYQRLPPHLQVAFIQGGYEPEISEKPGRRSWQRSCSALLSKARSP